MSTIIFTLDFPRETIGTDEERVRADKIRMDVMKGIISTLTGLDVIRQECFVTFVGADRKFIITVHETRILNTWLERAETLFRTGLLQGNLRWTGDLGHDDPSNPTVYPSGNWYVIPEETGTHWIEFRCDGPTGKMKTETKWDGCTHVWLDVDTEDECYHHICDLDLFADYLQSVRAKARDYFDGEFCVSGISEEDRLKKIAKLQEQEKL